MAGSAGSIFVDLLLRDSQYSTGWNKARQTTRQSTSQIQGDLGKTQQAFRNVISPVDNVASAISSLGAVVAGALSIQQLVRYSDTWTQLEGRLNLVVASMDQLGGTQDALFDIAQRTRQPLEGVYNLYTRLAQAIPAAARSQFDLLGVTESINLALAITGEGSAQAASAILQFTQAAASGFKASGQEINALLDSAPRLALAIQRSFGDGTKSLKQLSEAGELDLGKILNALSGVGEEGKRLREEFEKLPPTIGQSFTQLDNAFLSFIGNNEAVAAGSSSLVLVIQTLAENLDLAAKAIIALSVVFTARLLPDLAKSVISFTASQGSAIGYTAAINSTSAALGANSLASQRWAAAIATQQAAAAGSISSTVIAVNRAGQAATVTASAFSLMSVAASRAGGALLALVGGLPGAAFLAVTAAVYSFNDSLNQAEKVSQKYKGISSELYSLNLQIVNASEKRKVALIEERDELLKKAQAEIKDTEALLKKYEVLQEIGGIFNLGATFFARRGEDAVRERLDQLYKELEDINAQQIDVINNGVDTGTGGGLPSYDDGEAAKKRQKEIQQMYEKYEYLIKGVKQEVITYRREEEELGKLFESNTITLDEYYTALSGLDEKYDETMKKADKFGVDSEQFAKRAAENIQDAFADFLYDPFQDGLDGMLKGFVDTVRKMIAEAQAAKLAKSLFGELAGGEGDGVLGGILGSVFKGFGGGGETAVDSAGWFDGWFADGGFIQPGHVGIAGEEGAELVYGGRSGATVVPNASGGNTYNIDARGADMGAVARLQQSLLALAGPGVIEQRVSNAQMRGAL